MPLTSIFALMFWASIGVLALIAMSPPESDTVAELVTGWIAGILLLSMAAGGVGWVIRA